MSDTARESNPTTDAQAKPASFLSKVNPLNFVANEFSALTGNSRPHSGQLDHQRRGDFSDIKDLPLINKDSSLNFVANEISTVTNKNKPHVIQPVKRPSGRLEPKEDFGDTKDVSLIKEDLTVKKEVLHRADIETLNNKMDQVEDTCGRIILEIYSNSKKPPTRRSEAQQAVKQLPVNVTDANRKNVDALFEVLEKDGMLGNRNIEHCGMPSLYDDAYGRHIQDELVKANPELGKILNEPLNDFKAQVKVAKREFDKLKTIHDNEPTAPAGFDYVNEHKQYSNENLRSIAAHAVNMIIALERSKNWLNKLNVADLDKSELDIAIDKQKAEMKQQQARENELKQQQQQLARAQEAVAARPYKDSLELLSPYSELAKHVKAVDDQVIKILQEVNPQNLSEIVYYPHQTTPPRRSLPMSALRTLVGVTIPLPLSPLGHYSGPIAYNPGDDPFQPYNEFKVRGDLRKLSEAIKSVKEDFKANNGMISLLEAEKDSTKDKYSPVLNDAGKPEINAEVKSHLSTFRVNATNMFTQPNKTEDELEKMCVVGEMVNREELKKEVNFVYANKEYQALRKSCDDVLKEVKDVSEKYEYIRRGSALTP